MAAPAAAGSHGDARPQLLFLCVHNSGRSQMAEGFARHLSAGKVVSHSAGSHPGASLNPKVVEAMKEVGIDITTHHPKGIDLAIVPQQRFVITMGCGDACPRFAGVSYIDWGLPDMTGMDLAGVRRVRDIIAGRVRTLLTLVGVAVGTSAADRSSWEAWQGAGAPGAAGGAPAGGAKPGEYPWTRKGSQPGSALAAGVQSGGANAAGALQAAGRPYNFARASARDAWVFGCCRPGPTPYRPLERSALPITAPDVDAWVAFMRAQGVTHVLSLLAPDELAAFAEPVGEAMMNACLVYTNVWLQSPGARAAAMQAIDDARLTPGARIAVHCWGGGGRAGKVLAAWLCHRHGLAAADAAAEIVKEAAASGVERRADAESLALFLKS